MVCDVGTCLVCFSHSVSLEQLDCDTWERSCSLRTTPIVFVCAERLMFCCEEWAIVGWVWGMFTVCLWSLQLLCILDCALTVSPSFVRQAVYMREVSLWLIHEQRGMTKSLGLRMKIPRAQKSNPNIWKLACTGPHVPHLMTLESSHTGFHTPEEW